MTGPRGIPHIVTMVDEAADFAEPRRIKRTLIHTALPFMGVQVGTHDSVAAEIAHRINQPVA